MTKIFSKDQRRKDAKLAIIKPLLKKLGFQLILKKIAFLPVFPKKKKTTLGVKTTSSISSTLRTKNEIETK